MKKYKLMLTALLGAAFLFAPHENAGAAEPSDIVSVSVEETYENADSDWLSGYHYELLDDGETEPVVRLKKCYLSGDVSVYGTATVEGRTYRTFVTKECFSDCAGIRSLGFVADDGIKPLADEDMQEAFSKDPCLERIDIRGLDLSNTKNISMMFSKNESLSDIILSNDTLGNSYDEPVVIANKVFSESPSIVALDLSGFDTTNVVNMEHIFSYMQGVRSFKFGGVFDTSNVTDLSFAFYDCPSFTGSLDLSKWNTAGKSSTANNKTMRSMFELFPAQAIILTDFDTSNVTDMTYAFANTSFSRIDLSSFDTSKVTTMYGMFDGTKVENDYLDWMMFGPGWNTAGVTNFSRMFNHRYITNSCANTFVAVTRTTSASNLVEMFYDTKINCNSAHATLSGASLDLQSWDISSVTDMSRFLKSGIVACNLTGWNYSSLQNGDDAFGGAASKATPAAYAAAIEAKRPSATVLDDTSKYNCYIYGRGYSGLTKDGTQFSTASDSSVDTTGSIFGTTRDKLPIHFKLNMSFNYYIGDTFLTNTDPKGIMYSKVSTDSYSVSINKIQTPVTAEQKKWFCPYNAGLTTNGREDRNYYEIYGYSDGRLAFIYAPTQEEWNETLKRCEYTGNVNGFRNVCNEGKYLTNRMYGFREVDISEYLRKVDIQTPTVENGGLDMIGSSGTDYSSEYEESGMPFSNVTYVMGKENENTIRPVEKKNFVFLGWFDTDGNNLTDYTGGLYTPKGLSSEIIVPHYRIEEKDVRLSVTFETGEDAPDGLSLLIDPGFEDNFYLSREGDKWTGTFFTTVALKDRIFKLPVISIEGMDEENPEYEFLGWEGEDGSFTVSSSDTQKKFKAVFRHNEEETSDPGIDDPTQGDPAQNDPTQGDPAQNDPAQNDPTQGDPIQGDPAQNDPTQGDPAQNDPTQGDPAQNDPKQGDPAQNDPDQGGHSHDNPGQDEPRQDDPRQDDPKQGDPKQDDPKQDDPRQDDPRQDDPRQDDPKQDDPKQDDPKQDDPGQEDPSKDDPSHDTPSSELSEEIKALNDELSALRGEKAAADSRNNELVDNLNRKIAELENTISTLSQNMSKNDEVLASTEREGNAGSGSTGRSSSGSSSSAYGQGTGGSSDRYETSTGSTSKNTYSGASLGEKRSEAVFSTPSVPTQTIRSNDLSKMSAQPEPHYAYRTSNGSVKLNYDTSVINASKDTVEEYGFFTEGAKKEGSSHSSAKASSAKTSEKAAASSDEMKKAAGNTATHDDSLLEAQNIGRSIFGVMILVIVTGCAIFLTFRKKAVKKNRRTRK